MNIILLSGGSGKRLWPLSNDIRSKQFIKIFKKDDGTYESMLQRVYRQILSVDPNANVTIATSKSQISILNNQLGKKIGISIEPCRRDTFPAIALATAYLHDVQKVSSNHTVVVCPVDPYVSKDYFEAVEQLGNLAQIDDTNLMLMGITPTYPSEKYGYIIPYGTDAVSKVKTFKEKPDTKMAKNYITQGALWNGGVFAYKIQYVLEIAKELLGTADYYELYANYSTLPKISFDYAVVEKESNIKVMRFSGKWQDIGTWNTLTEAMGENSVGRCMIGRECENVHVINELDIPILCVGLKDIVVSASQDGILVSDKDQSSQIKSLVECLDQQMRFAEKSWGDYRVLGISNKSMTIEVTLNPRQCMSYHSHMMRNEVWIVTSGEGYTVVDGKKQEVKTGNVITIPVGSRHTVIAGNSELKIIEVQMGDEISVHDKEKFPLEGEGK